MTEPRNHRRYTREELDAMHAAVQARDELRAKFASDPIAGDAAILAHARAGHVLDETRQSRALLPAEKAERIHNAHARLDETREAANAAFESRDGKPPRRDADELAIADHAESMYAVGNALQRVAERRGNPGEALAQLRAAEKRSAETESHAAAAQERQRLAQIAREAN